MSRGNKPGSGKKGSKNCFVCGDIAVTTIRYDKGNQPVCAKDVNFKKKG